MRIFGAVSAARAYAAASGVASKRERNLLRSMSRLYRARAVSGGARRYNAGDYVRNYGSPEFDEGCGRGVAPAPGDGVRVASELHHRVGARRLRRARKLDRATLHRTYQRAVCRGG